MPEWTDEIKKKVIEQYKSKNPTPENTSELIKEIADNLGADYTANGVMAILNKAGEYVKKTAGTTKAKTTGDKTPRESKGDCVAALNNAIKATGQEPDSEIIGKLTGKAAKYFAEIINNAASD